MDGIRTPIKRLGGARPGRNVGLTIRIPKRCAEKLKTIVQDTDKTCSEVVHELVIKGLPKET